MLGISLLFSCATPSPHQDSAVVATTQPVLSTTDKCSVLVEELSSAPLHAGQPLGSHRHLLLTDDGLTYFNEVGDESSLLMSTESLGGVGQGVNFAGVPLDSSRILLTAEGKLYTFDGSWLSPSPISDQLPVPISSIQAERSVLWFFGADHLFRWQDGQIRQLRFEDSSSASSFLSAFHVAANGELALSIPELMLVDAQNQPAKVMEHHPDILPTSIQSTLAGDLWVADSSATLRRRDANGKWSDLLLASPINTLMASPMASKLWIELSLGTLVYEDGVLCEAELPDGEKLAVDSLGRMLVKAEQRLLRVAIDRPVAVVGMMPGESLSILKELQFLPTNSSTLTALSVWVGNQQLELDEDPLRAIINPDDYPVGEHQLRIFSQGDEGTTARFFPFITGDLPTVLWEELELMLVEKCLSCHSADALLPLHTKELWQHNIDSILSEVSTQSMPLGGPYLTEEEIISIRGWKYGGFQ